MKMSLKTAKYITGRFSAYCNTISQSTVSVINVLNLPVIKFILIKILTLTSQIQEDQRHLKHYAVY